MPKLFALAAAAALPCAAFVPQGAMRGHVVDETHNIGQQMPGASPSEAKSASVVIGMVGIGAAGLSMFAAQQRRKTARRVTTLEVEEAVTGPKATEWPAEGIAVAAAAAVPCAAFVPQGALRGHVVDETHNIGQQMPGASPSEAKSASVVIGMVGIGAAGLSMFAAQQRRKTARRVTTLEVEEAVTGPKATEWPDPNKRYSASVPFLLHPKQLDGWVGGEKGFDPLGTTDAIPVYLMREAELKHGRVCMLATIGWIATDLGARFPAQV
eukprot:CAMPEP_0172777598 /NCGR_PEP_ID=MMETSP1074-20121228/201483_1 /TAXON_ID=2916 /ORGANISM="Ceratium fusus, Strain PA161109" /LENGTH=267 /DNA_ID=CAMNT_0013614519 /DNA_START=64 /DNA_END=864 /DNA_ORIENTATION=-